MSCLAVIVSFKLMLLPALIVSIVRDLVKAPALYAGAVPPAVLSVVLFVTVLVVVVPVFDVSPSTETKTCSPVSVVT